MIAQQQLVLMSFFHGQSQDKNVTLTWFAYMCIFSRDELVSEQQQTAELQAKLSSTVQEKLAAEGQRERLELEIQRLNKQLLWHQEQRSTKQALSCSQKLEPHTSNIEPRLSPVEKSKDEGFDQVTLLIPVCGHI